MLPRRLRLTEKRTFDRIFRRGRTARGRFFGVRFLPAGHGGRVTFVVTKKVAKLATERNRTKRRARAAFGALIGSRLPVNDMVIVVYRSLAKVSYATVAQDAAAIWDQLEKKSKR